MNRFSLVFLVVTLFAPSSLLAGDFGIGPSIDGVAYLVEETSPATSPFAPGIGASARYAFREAEAGSFLGFDATASWLEYEDPYLPELLVRTRAVWGWRFGWSVPLDLSAGFTIAFPAQRASDPEVRFNRALPLPTIGVGTAWQGDGWELNIAIRLETVLPSAMIGVMWW